MQNIGKCFHENKKIKNRGAVFQSIFSNCFVVFGVDKFLSADKKLIIVNGAVIVGVFVLIVKTVDFRQYPPDQYGTGADNGDDS